MIGGGFGVAAWDHLIPSAERVLRREALLPARDEVEVVPAKLGTAAGLIGAAFVAYEALDAAVSQCRSPSAPRRSATSRT